MRYQDEVSARTLAIGNEGNGKLEGDSVLSAAKRGVAVAFLAISCLLQLSVKSPNSTTLDEVGWVVEAGSDHQQTSELAVSTALFLAAFVLWPRRR